MRTLKVMEKNDVEEVHNAYFTEFHRSLAYCNGVKRQMKNSTISACIEMQEPHEDSTKRDGQRGSQNEAKKKMSQQLLRFIRGGECCCNQAR